MQKDRMKKALREKEDEDDDGSSVLTVLLHARQSFLVDDQSEKESSIKVVRKNSVKIDPSYYSAGCSKAEPKIFAPPQTPFLGVCGQNLISWYGMVETVTTFTYTPSLVRIDARNHGNRPTHPQTNRQDRLQYTKTYSTDGRYTIISALLSEVKR